MKITDVRIRKSDKDSKLKAYASVTFDDCFVIHDIRILDGTTGLFVAMPSKKIRENEFKDICHPITTEMRNSIAQAVIDAYNNDVE